MTADRHTCRVDLHLVLRRDDRVLLGLRENTGWADGHWHLPAGHLESDEPVTVGVAREAAEELGITVARAELQLVHVRHHRTDSGRIALFFAAHTWTGEPVNQEPDKCAGLGWFPAAHLPEPVVDYARQALTDIAAGILLRDDGGWDGG